MLRLGRLLDAVTLRRVVAFLLLAGFARQILIVLGWLASVGWGLWGVPSVRACLLATANLAFEAILIFLAVRGLRSLLARRRREGARGTGRSLPCHGLPGSHEEKGGAERQGPDRPGEGGGDGRGAECR